MRNRDKILGNLEELYRWAFEDAREREDEEEMQRMDFQFQRDQLYLEVILDIRELVAAMETGENEEGKTTSLLERAQAIRRLTRLR
jgi:hypothetical protein